MRIKDAIRLHYKERGKGCIALEFPPTCRHIFYGDNIYYLSFPYHYFIINYFRPFFPLPIFLSDIRLAWRRQPLEKITDLMGGCLLPMGRFFRRFCWGNFKNIPHFTLNGWMKYVIKWFWQSTFVAENYSSLSLDDWHHWSKDDPSFIMGIDWKEDTPLLNIIKDDGKFKGLTSDKKLLSIK